MTVAGLQAPQDDEPPATAESVPLEKLQEFDRLMESGGIDAVIKAAMKMK